MRPSFFSARPLRALLGIHRAPLLSLSKEPPLHRRRHRASTPGDVLAYAFPTPSTGRYHQTDSFRSRRFSRPQRFAPHGALQVYCTLLPVMGSAWFLITSSPPNDRPKPAHSSLKPEILPKPSFPLSSTALHDSCSSSEDDFPLSQKLEEMNP